MFCRTWQHFNLLQKLETRESRPLMYEEMKTSADKIIKQISLCDLWKIVTTANMPRVRLPPCLLTSLPRVPCVGGRSRNMK